TRKDVEARLVTMADALQSVARVFLDSAPVIYFVERHPSYFDRVLELFQKLDLGSLSACTSAITLAECLIHPVRIADAGRLLQFEQLLMKGSGVDFIPLDGAMGRHAAELRVKYNLRLPDAFQVAASLARACDLFVTNDQVFRKVTEIP